MSTWQVKRDGFQVTGTVTKSGNSPARKKITLKYDEEDTKAAPPYMPLPSILILPEAIDGVIEALQQVKASLDAVTLE